LNSRGQLVGIPATIPGSGILATTVVDSRASLGNITVNTLDGDINASAGGILQIAFNGAATYNNFIKLTASRDIVAPGSGVIGSFVDLRARDVKGLVIGLRGIKIFGRRNVSVTAFSPGNVEISALGNVSGSIIGGGSVTVSGDSISADLISQNVSTSGDTSGSNEGIGKSDVVQNVPQIADNAGTVAASSDTDSLKDNRKPIRLAQKVGRVTVLLPKKE